MKYGKYKGFGCAQSIHFKDVFHDFFALVKPSTVVEIGIEEGGTSLALNDLLKSIGHSYKMISYEKYGRQSYSKLVDEGINVRVCNIFTEDYQNLNPLYLDEITNNLQRSGTTVLLCDGGQKKMEVKLLTDLLKVGDYVMAHDYASSAKYFVDNMLNKTWNWCEITDEHIHDTIVKNKLEPFMSDEFQTIAWMCRRKCA